MKFIVRAPRYLDDLLEGELADLGLVVTERAGSALSFEGELRDAYRVIMHSRIAARVILELGTAEVENADSIYEFVKTFDWRDHLSAAGTLAVSFSGTTDWMRTTTFGTQRVKDAVVDVMRERTGERPSVDTQRPDLRIDARLNGSAFCLGIDLLGTGLHQRGYRPTHGVYASLKENVASAILLRAGWPSRSDGGLFDPMCGSGTFLIEGAMIAGDIAPGLARPARGLSSWLGADRVALEEVRLAARERAKLGREKIGPIIGADINATALQAARDSVRRAGLDGAIELHRGDAATIEKPEKFDAGLVIANLPYGERLGEQDFDLRELYRAFGFHLANEFAGARATLLVPQDPVSKQIPLKPVKRHSVLNGGLDCWVLHFDLESTERSDERSKRSGERREAISNRLRKNRKRLRKWAERNRIEAYRLYDADIPEFSAAIDIYGHRVHVQEYEAPRSIDPDKARERFDDLLAVLPDVLDVEREDVVVKVRRRQRGTAQYDRRADTGQRFQVREGELRFLVNLDDYLDTGLFLDHRPMRRRIASEAAGKSFLNLFCYTGAVTVAAAAGGAANSLSVDMSNTYLDWAEDNFVLNELDPECHRLLRSDCLAWLGDERIDTRFDVVFLDPPTFSSSKKMDSTFDVARDQVDLVGSAMNKVDADGVLYFSTNYRGFKLDKFLEEKFDVEDISKSTFDPDFERRPNMHKVFALRHSR